MTRSIVSHWFLSIKMKGFKAESTDKKDSLLKNKLYLKPFIIIQEAMLLRLVKSINIFLTKVLLIQGLF